MSEHHSISKRCEAICRGCEGFWVSVNSEDSESWDASEESFGVAAETQGGINQERCLTGERRGEQLKRPIRNYRNVLVGGDHRCLGFQTRFSDSPPC
jgi:hypothetical protein